MGAVLRAYLEPHFPSPRCPAWEVVSLDLPQLCPSPSGTRKRRREGRGFPGWLWLRPPIKGRSSDKAAFSVTPVTWFRGSRPSPHLFWPWPCTIPLGPSTPLFLSGSSASMAGDPLGGRDCWRGHTTGVPQRAGCWWTSYKAQDSASQCRIIVWPKMSIVLRM